MDKISIAIVVSEFNKEITYKMSDLAKENIFKQDDVTLSYLCFVPGCYDMPLVINELLKRRDVDAVITLGAIIKGETKHDEVIANSVAKSFIDLSLKYRKPVILGIGGPDMTLEQAKDRVEIISSRTVIAAVNMARRLKKLKNQRSGLSTSPKVIV
ncbi:MAG TPA: 6,7-dimethyl-8-ribityllumazine synthase [Nitrososphaeraceae archaeon]|nr:6,7-dimethyl-8-ribityllumazine synthase [Nitrososphaeraceae archaeon]